MKKIGFILILFIITTAFTSKRVQALIQKEVKSVFNIESYTTESITVLSEINAILPIHIEDNNFVKISHNHQLKGFYYVGKAYGKVDYFDFIVIFNQDLIVSKVKILVYREEHGAEVGSKRWLKQFSGKSTEKKLVFQKDIAGISGATLSAKSLTKQVNKVLKTVSILHQKQVI